MIVQFKRCLYTLLSASSLGLASGGDVWANSSNSDLPKAQTERPKPLQILAKNLNNFDVFKPKPQTRNASFDFTLWDDLLNSFVVPFGPSLRQIARKPKPQVGTRLMQGNQSKYRLEGNKISYSLTPSQNFDVVTEYRKELVRIANEQDFQRFSRDEQLAFWFNLHNVVLIDEIAKNYPVRRPSSQITFGSNEVPLHDAKLITIKEVPLSLRDIREKIVYRNWSNPDVIYGFTHGDIGGPAIYTSAYKARNLSYALNYQAIEYINSLRGVQALYRDRKISKIYDEARPYFFTNWPADVEGHIRKHAETGALDAINKKRPLTFVNYDTTIADLLGGRTIVNTSPVFSTDAYATHFLPPILSERANKFEALRLKGYVYEGKTGTIIIEDIETVDTNSHGSREPR